MKRKKKKTKYVSGSKKSCRLCEYWEPLFVVDGNTAHSSEEEGRCLNEETKHYGMIMQHYDRCPKFRRRVRRES